MNQNGGRRRSAIFMKAAGLALSRALPSVCSSPSRTMAAAGAPGTKVLGSGWAFNLSRYFLKLSSKESPAAMLPVTKKP